MFIKLCADFSFCFTKRRSSDKVVINIDRVWLFRRINELVPERNENNLLALRIFRIMQKGLLSLYIPATKLYNCSLVRIVFPQNLISYEIIDELLKGKITSTLL